MFTSYAQNFEDVLLWRALREVQNGFYIDVGAWFPDEDSVTRAFSERGWRGINVEPLPELHELLTQRRPRDVNLAVAVSDDPGSAELFEVRGTGLSTLDSGLAAKHEAAGFVVSKTTVQLTTLAEICRAHAPAEIHFLKLDCEGSELAALKGADFSGFRPWIILVEATLPNSQVQNHQDWEPILMAANYRFSWFDGLNRFYIAADRFDELHHKLAVPPNVFDNFVRSGKLVGASVPALKAPHAVPPIHLGTEDRIALAARCRDCDALPKVPGAGQVQVEPDGTRVQIMHNGLKVLADGYYGEWMTRLIALCQGHHEPQEERVFEQVARLLPRDATIIELGGYWSYYSAWFLHGAPLRKAVILEPDPAHLAVGQRTMKLNGLNATFVAGVAGAESGALTPFDT